MALAFRILRWPPETFWRATPRELAAAIRAFGERGAVEAATSGDLARLMRDFPDLAVPPGAPAQYDSKGEAYGR